MNSIAKSATTLTSIAIAFFVFAAMAIRPTTGLQNGRCDGDFCACTVSFSTTDDANVGASHCPGWMQDIDIDADSPPSSLTGDGAGIETCVRPLSYRKREASGHQREDGSWFYSSFVIVGNDGNPIVNYTMDDQAPPCPKLAPQVSVTYMDSVADNVDTSDDSAAASALVASVGSAVMIGLSGLLLIAQLL